MMPFRGGAKNYAWMQVYAIASIFEETGHCIL